MHRLVTLSLALLLPSAALAWWTPSPEAPNAWQDVSAQSINDHGFMAANTVIALQQAGHPSGSVMGQYASAYAYGAWAEDFITGNSVADTLAAYGHYWDGGYGAPEAAQGWYDAAVVAWNLGQHERAVEYLGRASHYVQDMTQPFHALDPLEPHHSGVMCLHQPFYGISDYRSHCHSVVEIHVADREWTPVVPDFPNFQKKKQPGYAATAWARSIHGKGDRGVQSSIEDWHLAVRTEDWNDVEAQVPTLFGHAVAASAGMIDAFWAETH